MDLHIVSVFATQPRRIRIIFASPLASGAYVAGLYSVTSQDAISSSPAIRAVYGIAGQSSGVELVLGSELAPGGSYVVTAVGVPAANGNVTPVGTASNMRFGVPTKAPANAEILVSDNDAILFGVDIVWSNQDFEEGPDGDLAVQGGLANAESALAQRLLGSPLPYAPGYSPNSREYVDSNDASPLGARLKQQALRDARVKSVVVVAQADDDTSTTFSVTSTFIGNRSSQPISITVDS